MKLVHKLRLYWRKCKRLVEFLVFGLFDFLVLLTAPTALKTSKRIAIVHLKLLGDYFLWLPFGQQLVTYLQTQGNEVILIGNNDWITLTKQHFPKVSTIGIKNKNMLRDFHYRAVLLRQLRALGVGKILHPSCPRDAILEDAVVQALGSDAIGFASGFIDRSIFDMTITNRYYNELLPTMPGVHQTIRAAEFLQTIGIKTLTKASTLTSPELIHDLRGKQFFLLSPGGSRVTRQWPGHKVSQIARQVLENDYSTICVLAGISTELDLCQTVAENLPEGRWLNVCGKTTLSEFFGLVAHAQWVLCNDSAAGHIAAAYGVPAVVILGGGNFNLCYPYPENAPIRQHPICVWQTMPCFGCNWICRFQTSASKAYPCVENIDVESVWKAVVKCIDGEKTRVTWNATGRD